MLAEWSNARIIDLEIAGSNLAFEEVFLSKNRTSPSQYLGRGEMPYMPFDITATWRKCIAIKYVQLPTQTS